MNLNLKDDGAVAEHIPGFSMLSVQIISSSRPTRRTPWVGRLDDKVDLGNG
jgi:hypothetical protein